VSTSLTIPRGVGIQASVFHGGQTLCEPIPFGLSYLVIVLLNALYHVSSPVVVVADLTPSHATVEKSDVKAKRAGPLEG